MQRQEGFAIPFLWRTQWAPSHTASKRCELGGVETLLEAAFPVAAGTLVVADREGAPSLTQPFSLGERRALGPPPITKKRIKK